MSFLPRIKRCPNCASINLLKINGIAYENEFQTLKDWTLKKKTNCRKCKIEMGLFVNNESEEEKIIWIDIVKCEEAYTKKLDKLQKSKDKYKEKNKDKEFMKTIKEIQTIQNQIRLNQVKLKVKAKIENRGLFI